MKKLPIVLIILLVGLSCFASGETTIPLDTTDVMLVVDEPDSKARYEVTITVVYNALSIEDAAKISADAIERHKTACKTRVVMKKVERETPYITFEGAGVRIDGK